MHKNNIISWLYNIAVLIIVIAFFIISYSGFMMGDDLWMNGAVSNLYDLVKHTAGFYLHSGGRLFSVACQYLFSGVLGDNRIWYAIVNTLCLVYFDWWKAGPRWEKRICTPFVVVCIIVLVPVSSSKVHALLDSRICNLFMGKRVVICFCFVIPKV